LADGKATPMIVVVPNGRDAPRVWNVDSNGHDATEWRNSLYHFVQRILQ